MLRVTKIDREATRFRVEGNSLRCVNPGCGKHYQRRPTGFEELPAFIAFALRAIKGMLPGLRCVADTEAAIRRLFDRNKIKGGLRDGDQCRTCGAALEVRWHTVDLAAHGLNGACSCEFFEASQGPEVRRRDPEEQCQGRWRCSHIWAAREFALDLALAQHERARLKGRSEENQP